MRSARTTFLMALCLVMLMVVSVNGQEIDQERAKRITELEKTETTNRNLQGVKETIKQSAADFSMILAYAAVREGDASICRKLDKPEQCVDAAKGLMINKQIAEGKCSEIDAQYQNACINRDNCQAFDGVSREFCEDMNAGDARTIINKRKSSADYCAHMGGPPSECAKNYLPAIEALAVYQGVKHYWSKRVCDKYNSYLQQNKQSLYLCDVVFGTQHIDEILDTIATDLTYLEYAKSSKDKKFCEKIKNKTLREKCQAGSIK